MKNRFARNLLVSNPHQTQPGKVPASVRLWVPPDAEEGVSHNISTEGIVDCQASELGKELIAIDVVLPGGGHGLLECLGIILVVTRGGDTLDSTQLRECVDSMCL
jgi:hypothetical protein